MSKVQAPVVCHQTAMFRRFDPLNGEQSRPTQKRHLLAQRRIMRCTLSLHLIHPFLGDRLQNGSPYAIIPLSACLSVCLSACLSVTLVYWIQTVEWIKMKLGLPVGLGPRHIVLDGDLDPQPQSGTASSFRTYLLWPNGWMD